MIEWLKLPLKTNLPVQLMTCRSMGFRWLAALWNKNLCVRLYVNCISAYYWCWLWNSCPWFHDWTLGCHFFQQVFFSCFRTSTTFFTGQVQALRSRHKLDVFFKRCTSFVYTNVGRKHEQSLESNKFELILQEHRSTDRCLILYIINYYYI